MNSSIKLFANDTSLYMNVDDPVDAAETLNTDLAKIHDWSMKWLVKFNPDKTESMIVSRKSNRPLHPPLMMDNKIINMVSEHKHVGLTISNDGNWGKHVDLITKKAFRERPFNLKGMVFSKKNILIPNVAEKNILILMEEKK